MSDADRREPWRLVMTWRGEPGWNMALDEALLECREPRPTLRFYTWSPAALSLGYFQRFEELAPRAAGTVLVRRFSGGGAIHHEDELTFAIAGSQDHPLFRGEVRGSYARVHAVLASAFATLGVAATPCGARPLASDRSGTGMCFHASTPLDLAWGDKKGVGSAQRRRAGRVLHHGSIKLGVSALEEGVAALPRTNPEALAELVATRFERELPCRFTRESPTPEELEHARLRADFYRSPEFLRRR